MKLSLIITGWNCQNFAAKCLKSIKSQSYKPFEVIIVDDGSTDNTYNEIIKNAPHESHVIRLPENVGTYYARDKAIQQAKGDIIVMIDMDDYLLNDAISKINKAYESNNDILMTYGNYQYLDGKKCPVDINYSAHIHRNRDYRNDTWRCTHLRSFSKKMYNLIPKWDLTKAEINSYPDVEILFSMMEMAGKDRIAVIQEPIYVYNTSNPESTLKRFGKDYPGYYELVKREKRELLPLNKDNWI